MASRLNQNRIQSADVIAHQDCRPGLGNRAWADHAHPVVKAAEANIRGLKNSGDRVVFRAAVDRNIMSHASGRDTASSAIRQIARYNAPGMSSTPARPEELIRRAKAGDHSSLESLLLRFHNPLLAMIRNLAPRRDSAWLSAEDILQETFVEAFRHIGSLHACDERGFLAWMKTIARTRLINQINAHRAKKRGGDATTEATATTLLGQIAGRDPTPSLHLRRKEAVDAVRKAMLQLDPFKRHVLELRFGRKMPVPELAAQIGKSEPATRMIINRSIKELRQIMDRLGEFTILP
jgi:RNA polymerase sigma-70 factor, ECF subfamily